MSGLDVLLIIGSAVVGPIEAQLKGYPDQVCADPWVMSTPEPMPRCKYESLPELCARAMREIGAERDVRGHWWLFRTVGTADPQPNDYNKPMEVRCIPVPTGFKK